MIHSQVTSCFGKSFQWLTLDPFSKYLYQDKYLRYFINMSFHTHSSTSVTIPLFISCYKFTVIDPVPVNKHKKMKFTTQFTFSTGSYNHILSTIILAKCSLMPFWTVIYCHGKEMFLIFFANLMGVYWLNIYHCSHSTLLTVNLAK